jgi:hypothetical protein
VTQPHCRISACVQQAGLNKRAYYPHPSSVGGAFLLEHRELYITHSRTKILALKHEVAAQFDCTDVDQENSDFLQDVDITRFGALLYTHCLCVFFCPSASAWSLGGRPSILDQQC